VARDGTDITEAYARTGVSTGITFGIELEGLVPPYEEYAAMVASHYNSHDWQDLPASERATAVAFYRLAHLVELHGQDAVAIHSQRQAAGGSDANG
jgi:hypothetical protein